MNLRSGTVLCLALLAPCASHAQKADAVRSGESAYGDWRADAPGVMRHIRPQDMPRPGATAAAASGARFVASADRSLKVPPGFSATLLTGKVPGARTVRVAPNGDIFTAQSEGGRVTVLRLSKDRSKVERTETFASQLSLPYGIAFYPPGPNPQWVYVGEPTRVVRFAYKVGDMKASAAPQVAASGVPGGGHWTRDVAFSPDGKTMYVAVGSQSNVAEGMGRTTDIAQFEKTHGVGASWGSEEWRASVLAFDPDGKNRRVFASGIRNCAGLAVQPGTGVPFCATNERDNLGDNLPPDYVTSVKQGGFYGWPWYYIGGNQDPRHAGARPDLKDEVIVPDVLFQPHSAPLNLAFNPGGNFPDAWKGDAFVAMHGSWNRGQRTGYKVVRLPFRDGKPTGEYEDFVTGFVLGDRDVWGRPVGVAFLDDGSLIFSDDDGGTIWRVARR